MKTIGDGIMESKMPVKKYMLVGTGYEFERIGTMENGFPIYKENYVKDGFKMEIRIRDLFDGYSIRDIIDLLLGKTLYMGKYDVRLERINNGN